MKLGNGSPHTAFRGSPLVKQEDLLGRTSKNASEPLLGENNHFDRQMDLFDSRLFP